jgi:hypothetical protein
MKIRNLLVLMMTIALTTICAAAQDGYVTIKDHTNQSLTVSRFGAVVKFIERDGHEIVPKHNFRICSCNNAWPCFDSEDPKDARVTLEVLSPVNNQKQKRPQILGFQLGKRLELKRGKSLELQATIAFRGVTVMRRLVWTAGSSSVRIQTLTWSGDPICCIHDQSLVPLNFAHHGCQMPPPEGFNFTCPPPPDLFLKAPRDSSQHTATFILEFALWRWDLNNR